jgi:hypothetical protein
MIQIVRGSDRNVHRPSRRISGPFWARSTSYSADGVPAAYWRPLRRSPSPPKGTN